MRSNKLTLKTVSSYAVGLHAEARASQFLINLNYKILAKRLKTPYGEIDLLAQDNQTLVAIEVKYRKTMAQAHYSVLPKQQQRIGNALMWLLSQAQMHQLAAQKINEQATNEQNLNSNVTTKKSPESQLVKLISSTNFKLLGVKAI